MFNETSKTECALTCSYPELDEHVFFCSGEVVGLSVPLKGIRFEGATAGELTYSPALPFSPSLGFHGCIQSSASTMFMQYVMFMQRLPTHATAFRARINTHSVHLSAAYQCFSYWTVW